MGTTQKTDQTTKFDPASMAAFHQATPAWMQPATGYATNPFGNPFFQTQQQLGTRQAQNLGGTQMSNVARNITASGMGGGNMSPAALEMLQNQGRANTGLQSQLGFLNPVQNALALQQNAMGLLQGYRPLQTGGTTTQSTGGLGTWLPQVAGMALGAATGGLGGGLGALFGGGPKSGAFMGGSPEALMGSNNANQGFIGAMGAPPPWQPGGSGFGGLQAPGGGGGNWIDLGQGGIGMGSGSGISGQGGFPWMQPGP